MLTTGTGLLAPPPPPPPPRTAARQIPFSQFSHFPTKTHRFNLSFLSHSPILIQFRTGFNPLSLKGARKGENIVLETDDFDDEDEFDEDFDDDEDEFDEGFDDEDEEGEFVPLGSMKKWLEKKPRGFGDGKEYDTSVEDKLLEEIQQSREAQLANINKLKHSSLVSKNAIGLERKASEVVPSGVRVRLSNLPKKKNIDRDLKRAFKGIPGILNIIPAVSGNKKTRDPVCKGIAFVDLKSEDFAHRFAKVVSGQSISFGKMEKQIKCEVMSSKPQNSALGQSIDTDINAKGIYSDSRDTISSEESEDINENVELISSEEIKDENKAVGFEKLVAATESISGSKSSKQKVGAKEKKHEDKQKRPKVPKLNVPGSANRLKVREKAMLTEVLSKYAATSSALQKQR